MVYYFTDRISTELAEICPRGRAIILDAYNYADKVCLSLRILGDTKRSYIFAIGKEIAERLKNEMGIGPLEDMADREVDIFNSSRGEGEIVAVSLADEFNSSDEESV